MTTRVYHLDSRATDAQRVAVMFGKADISGLWPQGVYILVAEVATNSADVAFRSTNSVEAGWWDYEANGSAAHVRPLFAGEGCRSTSVGDVVATPDGVYACARMGWERLSLDPRSAPPLPPAGFGFTQVRGATHLTPMRGEVSPCGARGLPNDADINGVTCAQCAAAHEAYLLAEAGLLTPQEFCRQLRAHRQTVVGCKLTEEGTVRVRDSSLLWVTLPLEPRADCVQDAAKMLASADAELRSEDTEMKRGWAA